MKRKRLDRDLWGFGNFPYYQMRTDCDDFHGLAALIRQTDGEYCYWDPAKAGKMAVCGKGMIWLQLVPDGRNCLITIMLLPEKKITGGVEYPYSVSGWYVDVIEKLEYDEDGVAAFVDKYPDVIFTPQGDVLVDDREELDEAYKTGELSAEQYQNALEEGDKIVRDYCTDIAATEQWSCRLWKYVEERIQAGDAGKLAGKKA